QPHSTVLCAGACRDGCVPSASLLPAEIPPDLDHLADDLGSAGSGGAHETGAALGCRSQDKVARDDRYSTSDDHEVAHGDVRRGGLELFGDPHREEFLVAIIDSDPAVDV